MGSFLNKTKLAEAGGRPPAAIEIAPEGVLAAARPAAGARRGASELAQGNVYAFVPLPAGAHRSRHRRTQSARARSRHRRHPLGARLKSRPARRAVTVVLPDTLVRVFVLDFDSLPAKACRSHPRRALPPAQNGSLRRGARRRQLPGARRRTETEWKVLAAVMPGPILAEYEAAVRAAGYEPGAVLSPPASPRLRRSIPWKP